MAPSGITLPQYILRDLHATEPGALATLRRTERSRLVTRVRDAVDRRTFGVYVTANGKEFR
ncbi:MAG: hypothetical protein ABR591_09585 [Candidatus Velthaea sp.]